MHVTAYKLKHYTKKIQVFYDEQSFIKISTWLYSVNTYNTYLHTKHQDFTRQTTSSFYLLEKSNICKWYILLRAKSFCWVETHTPTDKRRWYMKKMFPFIWLDIEDNFFHPSFIIQNSACVMLKSMVTVSYYSQVLFIRKKKQQQ